ncbi:hypothetical protein [Pseudomonas juntendi]|uniref:Uncharacterized protein n=1 Tax=Pseudomonas juntendi TaxID=2666183 RepID=A0AAJ5RUT6_9PSED|nr:hypothetical protein [Pseudomonas juntendi]WEA18924.1 hypothetical protein PWA60_16650 [Pseudomonas juntendi]
MQPERVKLLLDKEWKLEDLAVVSKNYNQLYAFAYSLQTNLSAFRQQQVVAAYANLPWRGGFSTVNFFTHVFRRIPPENQPRVTRITYASPGFIELAALATVCYTVSRIVTAVAHSIRTAYDTYSHIRKGMQERKLSQLQANLKEAELLMQTHDFCEKSCAQLVRTMGISFEEDAALEQRTKGNKLMKLKLMMSVFRRVAPLAEKQSKGMLKVDIPPPAFITPPSPPPRDPLV